MPGCVGVRCSGQVWPGSGGGAEGDDKECLSNWHHHFSSSPFTLNTPTMAAQQTYGS